MKTKSYIRNLVAFAAFLAAGASTAHAQYFQMVNQTTNMLQTALAGGARYRGLADASYTFGVGSNACSFLEISTTHGIKYGSWFFIGAGLGVDVIFAGDKGNMSTHPTNPSWSHGFNIDNGYSQTGVIIPLYSDFRFNIGKENKTSGYVDVRAGASFLIGRNYICTPDGYLNNSEGFYLKPSVGLRIPVNSKDSRQAVNIGASYQLVTTNSWDWTGYYHNTCVNAIGINAGFEW